jgi:uroporphyrinogen decarboxylase
MTPLTGRERIARILKHEPVDRIGLYEHFWGDTRKKWTEDGFINEEDDLIQHFDLDIRQNGPLNMVIDLDFERQLLEETEDTELYLDGNGAKLRWHKKHASTPEHVGFTITCRRDWEEIAKPKLKAESRRIDYEGYRDAKKQAEAENRFFCWTGMHVFEIMKNVAGHEHMLVGMALEPEWIQDMVMTYSQMYVDMQQMLFEAEGYPDGIWYYEDMGFKQRPFMSPDMYMELVQPGHKLTFQYAHSGNLPVIIHTCGFVEALVPGLIDAGMDCLQVIEIKAGMDLLKLYREYGDAISFMGGIDVRELYTNDRERIRTELERKVPVVKSKFGYVLHSDHSIPNTVDYESYRYFIETGKELGSYS